MTAKKTWKCRKCGGVSTNTRLRICPNPTCKTRRLPKKRRGHMKALDIPYETYVAINGGEHCGICEREPKRDAEGVIIRRHDRDHDHKTGLPRGLLCPGRMGCNRKLGRVDDLDWLEGTMDYLSTANNRRAKAQL